MEFVLAFIIGVGFGIFFEFALHHLKDEYKPKAIFHMTNFGNQIESWMEFEDDPASFYNGEEILVIVKHEEDNQND